MRWPEGGGLVQLLGDPGIGGMPRHPEWTTRREPDSTMKCTLTWRKNRSMTGRKSQAPTSFA